MNPSTNSRRHKKVGPPRLSLVPNTGSKVLTPFTAEEAEIAAQYLVGDDDAAGIGDKTFSEMRLRQVRAAEYILFLRYRALKEEAARIGAVVSMESRSA